MPSITLTIDWYDVLTLACLVTAGGALYTEGIGFLVAYVAVLLAVLCYCAGGFKQR